MGSRANLGSQGRRWKVMKYPKIKFPKIRLPKRVKKGEEKKKGS